MKMHLLTKSCASYAIIIGLIAVYATGLSQVSLTDASPTYTQDFNAVRDNVANTGLPNGTDFTESTDVPWVNNVTFPGWYMFCRPNATMVNTEVTVIRACHGQTNSGKSYSFGVVGEVDRCLGSVLSSTLGWKAYGLRLRNAGSAAITSLLITYTGEQWRADDGGIAAVHKPLGFSYVTETTTTVDATARTIAPWVDVPELDFQCPIVAAALTPQILDGNQTANRTVKTHTITGLNIAPASEVMLRWFQSNDDNSHNDGFGIDDLSVTATFVSGVTDWSIY